MQSLANARLDIVKAAIQRVPLNSYGLPEGFYRPDLLPTDPSSLTTTDYVEVKDAPAILPAGSGANSGAVKLKRPAIAFGSKKGPKPIPDTLKSASVPSKPNAGHFQKSYDGEILSALPGDGDSRVVSSGAENLEPLTKDAPTVVEESKGILDTLPEGTLENAYVPLSYMEGFPALPDGKPFWSQLEFEAPHAFLAFDAYREQGLKGARQLFALELDDDFRAKIISAKLPMPTAGEIQEWAVLHYWFQRCKAFDMFHVAAQRRSNETRAISLQNKHYADATRLYDRLLLYMESEEFWETLTPQAAIKMMAEVSRLQRMSIGLPAGGVSGASAPDGSQTTSFEAIVRSVAKTLNPTDNVNPIAKDTADTLRRAMVGDPKLIAHAQEVILRMTQTQPKGDGYGN
jgi:hypothetical protein